MNPFISVIMVAYNGEKYLNKSLSSIAAQTFRDFELVFVNNGSTDSTADIISEFIINNPSVNVVCANIEVNDGLPKGRNCGINHAQGDYFMFHDVDDWMDADCLKELASAAEKYCADRIIQAIRYVNETGNVLNELYLTPRASRWSKNSLQGDLFSKHVIFDNHIRFSEKAYFDDFYFTNQFSSYTQSVHFICKSYYNMLLHQQSMTHKFTGDLDYFVPRLEKTFAELEDVAPRLKDLADKTGYQYNCIQKYYTSVFGGVNLPLREKLIAYKKYKNIMEKYYPDYKENKAVKLFAENGYYGKFKRNIWICVLAERIDSAVHLSVVMPLILAIYHLALKAGTYKYW